MEKIRPPSPELDSSFKAGMRLAVGVGHTITCFMMVCVALGFVFAARRLSPNWNGFYLVGLALFVSIESILARKRVVDLDDKEKIFFRIAEGVALAVLVKVSQYIVHGPAQLIEDIPLWQNRFMESFFTREYVFVLVVLLLIWWASAAHAAEIEELFEREVEADWDDLGKVQNALRDIRNRISARAFIIGALLVGLAVISRLESSLTFLEPGNPSTRGNFLPVVTVMAYFALALALLTQTQFVLLRARWIYQRLTVSPNLARNWMKYGLMFFVILALVVTFLPTDYSLGLFDTLRVAFNYLTQVVTFLLVILMIPFALCLRLFPSGGKPSGDIPGGTMGTFPAATPGQAPEWWDFIKSLAFWVLFIGIIFFALRYYLMQNTALWKAIQNFPLTRWISTAWERLRNWIKGANKQVSALVSAGIKRLRAQRALLPANLLRKITNLSRMSAREKIIYFYMNLVQLGGTRGLERRTSQTPYKYQQQLVQNLPELEEDLSGLTETFLDARYSDHPVEEPAATQASSLWEHIKAVLRAWKDPN